MQKIDIWDSIYLYGRKIIFFLLISLNIFSQEEKVKRLPLVDKSNFIFGFNLSYITTTFDIVASNVGTLGGIDGNKNGGINLAYSDYAGGFSATGYMSKSLFYPYLRVIVEAGGMVGRKIMKYRQK